jgi:hypothetical protein
LQMIVPWNSLSVVIKKRCKRVAKKRTRTWKKNNKE